MWIWTLWIVKRAWIYLSNSSDHRLKETWAGQERVVVSNKGYRQQRKKIMVKACTQYCKIWGTLFTFFEWLKTSTHFKGTSWSFHTLRRRLPVPFPEHKLRDDWNELCKKTQITPATESALVQRLPGWREVGRWNERSSLRATYDSEYDWHERSLSASGALWSQQNFPLDQLEIFFSLRKDFSIMHYNWASF